MEASGNEILPGIAQTGLDDVASKRKRRESWGAIRERASGRLQASYTGPDGRRYNAPHTFDSMQDARGWLARMRVAVESGDWQAHSAVAEASTKAARADTLADYAHTWIASRVNRKGERLRPRTRVEYERLIDGPLEPLARLRLSALSPESVRDWYAMTVDRTPTQAGRAYSLLKSVLTTALQDGRIKQNPCQIRGAANASTGRKVVPPTSAELAKIRDAIAPKYRAAVLIAAWAGVRYGELTELRRSDLTVVRADDGAPDYIVVSVSRAVAHVAGQGFIVGKTKSDAGIRSIALPPHVTSDVIDHLDKFTGKSADALLFPAANGHGHLAQSTFTKAWYPARRAAGCESTPWHALRHYGATRFALTGATTKEIQERIGHSTVSAAMRYQHTAGRDAELARRMSDMETG